MSGASLNGAIFLILSQASTKAFTFVSNQLLVHNITPEIFGIAAYLEFVINSVLFFSREAERMAIQRASGGSDVENRRSVANFAMVPIIIGVPISAAVFLLQRSSNLYQTVLAPLNYSGWSISLIAALLLLELLSEPGYAINQYNLGFRARSKIESSAVFTKCLVTFAGVVLSKRASAEQFPGLAVASFAAGHLAYSLVNFLAYSNLTDNRDKIEVAQEPANPTKTKQPFLDPGIWSVWKSLFVQMIFKHILTEGDTLLMSSLFAVGDQGIYSVVSNYGSILARLLFQPIEEFLRVSFTRNFSSKQPDISLANTLMENLLVFYFDLSLLIMLGGYTNGSFMLKLLLGRSEKWAASRVFEVLPQYMLYLPFLAFNGILEAFFSSASTQKEITRFSYFMSILSVLILVLLYVLVEKLNLNLTGVILANMINMSLRIVYCLKFYFHFIRQHGTVTSFKHMSLRLTAPLAVVALISLLQAQFFHQSSSWPELGFSVVLCILALIAMVILERKSLLPYLQK